MASSNGGLGLYQTYGPDGRGLSTPVQNVANYWWYTGGLAVGKRFYHFGERYLEVGPDRWTQPDPMTHLSDPQQHDPYVYVGDDPINLTDPRGTSAAECAVSIIGASAAVIGGLAIPNPVSFFGAVAFIGGAASGSGIASSC